MRPFTIYPAIDLLNGNVVRLKQGDPLQKTIYSSNPEEIALIWSGFDARWLHIINLDGALDSTDDKNLFAVQKILATVKSDKIKIQVGGGLRSLEMIKKMIDLGVSRVILGTIIVENPAMVTSAINEFGAQRIVAGIDARDGKVRTHGWTVDQSVDALTLSLSMKQIGIETIIYTDISRDGVGGGVNLKSSINLAQKSGLDVIASGGIFTKEDILAVKEAGLPGVVVGRALYEKSIDPQTIFGMQE